MTLPSEATLDDLRHSLPFNIEVEQAVLAAIIGGHPDDSYRCYEAVADKLRPEHFVEPSHGAIYEAIGEIFAGGGRVSVITLKGHFEKRDALETVGGVAYLMGFLDAAPTYINQADYAETLVDLYMRREAMMKCFEAAEELSKFSLNHEARQVIDKAASDFLELVEIGLVDGGPQRLGQLTDDALETVQRAVESDGALIGMPTGLADLDDFIGGLEAGVLYVMAGRPSMGKTALALDIAKRVTRRRAEDPNDEAGGTCLMFSLEMPNKQLVQRILGSEAKVQVQDMRKGRLDQQQIGYLEERAKWVDQWPFFMDDTPRLTVGQMHVRARRLARRTNGLGLIVVDHLGRIAPDDPRAKPVDQLSQMTKGIAAMAKDLGVPALLLVQLNREVEKRDDKRPSLADLRGSGAIEEDADVVMFIYREEYYRAKKRPRFSDDMTENEKHRQELMHEERVKEVKGITEVIVEKQRQGPTGTRKIYFDNELMRFENLERSKW